MIIERKHRIGYIEISVLLAEVFRFLYNRFNLTQFFTVAHFLKFSLRVGFEIIDDGGFSLSHEGDLFKFSGIAGGEILFHPCKLFG